MKNMRLGLMAIVVLGFGALAFAAQTYEEALHSRKQSIRDWETVAATLRKAGIKEDSSAYKRVHEALKRNETRLKHLEKEGASGFKRSHATKAGQMASTAAGTAAGTGILGKLGGLFGGSKESTAASEAAKAETIKTAAKKGDVAARNVTKKAHKKAYGFRTKRSKKHLGVKHHEVKHAPTKR